VLSKILVSFPCKVTGGDFRRENGTRNPIGARSDFVVVAAAAAVEEAAGPVPGKVA